MYTRIKQLAKKFVPKYSSLKVPVEWIEKSDRSFLAQYFKDDFIEPEKTSYSSRIEELAKETNQFGPQPLWSGYQGNNIAGPTRTPDVVRTSPTIGNLYCDLVQKLKPNTIVEFGTAFGVSGMYFLAGIESNRKGQLLTFEPNDVWRNIAVRNLAQISNRFNSVLGTFEEHIDRILAEAQTIDLAFIDAIHTKEFVISQLETVIARSNDKAIIILDDINFSDSMRECWKQVSRDRRFSSSVTISQRVGIIELGEF